MSGPGTGRVAGKTIVVTGGSGDLGRATIDLLVAEGARIASLDLRSDPDRDSESITSFGLDITDEAQLADTVEHIVERVGVPDALVNAAGIIGVSGPSHTASVSDFDTIFNVNVKGTWLMTKHVVPHLIAARAGSIVNFSSIHGLTGGKSVPLYHATKGAVRLLTKADAVTYGEYGIRVNSIHPGSMNTRMSRASAEASPIGAKAYYEQLFGRNPLPRQGEPIEIAYGVVYLVSDESRFTTGSELVIDGGYTAI